MYGFIKNHPLGNVDKLGKNFVDFMNKRKGYQIPKAWGVNIGILAALKAKPVDQGFKAGPIFGASVAAIFFPDTCEIASYRIYTGMGKAWFEKRLPTEEEFSGKSMRTGEYTFEGFLKEFLTHMEIGVIATAGVSVEAAVNVGNQTPGIADSDSFEGPFHTFQADAFVASGSLYIGDKDDNGVRWVGGTFGIPGLGIGLGGAKVDWVYKKLDYIDLDDEGGPIRKAIGKCICYSMILLGP